MSDIYPGAGVFPKTVGDLEIFKVRVLCRNCGRLAVLPPGMRSDLDQSLDLVDLLTRLQCKGKRSRDPRDKGCGARPTELQIILEPPPNPVAYRATRMWVMDRAGEWEERPYEVLDELAER